MIVTIDGPAGAGKSSVARKLAERLDFRFLDTGAMYRAVTLAAKRQQIDWRDTGALARISADLDLDLADGRVLMDGEDVTRAIRTFEITTLTRHAADNLAVRERMVELQRTLAHGSNEVRARRRYEDLLARGEQVTLEEVAENQLQRDRRDAEREFGGVQKASDSIEVGTDGMTTDEVLEHLESIVRERMS